jgi:hypothetical protein
MVQNLVPCQSQVTIKDTVPEITVLPLTWTAATHRFD